MHQLVTGACLCLSVCRCVCTYLSICVCQPGDPCMVVPSLSPDEAKKEFPNMEQVSVPSGKGYLRFTPDYWLPQATYQYTHRHIYKHTYGLFTPLTWTRKNCLVLSAVVFTPPTRTHRNWVETRQSCLVCGVNKPLHTQTQCLPMAYILLISQLCGDCLNAIFLHAIAHKL